MSSTTRALHIGRGLSLPAEEFVESKAAIIGQSGRGKSGLLKVIEEELVRLNLPFVVFDPAGVAWGLRSSLDGKGPGLPCLVIGGVHGDLPLNRKAGAEVATAVVESNVSCIVDFSDEPKAAYREFLREFCDRLYSASATSTSPRLVVIDEAKEVVPQTIRPDQAQTYDSVERLVRQGRNRGIGVVLVSQRMATINKDVLTQCGSLFVFGLVGTQDRKALQDWVSAWGTADQLEAFEGGLAALQRRECWFWSPQEFERFQRVKVRDFSTFHPDRTHLRREGLLAVKPATVDVPDVIKKLGATFSRLREQKVDSHDAPRLRSEVARLTRELEAARSVPRSTGASKIELQTAVRAAEEPLKTEIRRMRADLGQAVKLREKVDRAMQILTAVQSATAPAREPTVIQSTPSPMQKVLELRVRDSPPQSGDESGPARPTGGALRMLRALAARHPLSISRVDLGVLGEIAPGSGTFSDYLSLLRRNGFIQELSDGTIAAAPEGVAFAGVTASDRASPEEVQRSALGRVSGGARRMLEVLIRTYPEPIERQQLGENASVSPESGTFSDYLSMLRRLGFAEDQGRQVRAREVLFA